MTQELIDKYQLEPLEQEGGYFAPVYRSERQFDHQGQQRSLGSHIYYYLNSDDFSAWHRVDCDELWHFYGGSDCILHLFTEQGDLSCVKLGDLGNGAQVCHLVPAGTWMAAEVGCENAYVFLGCTCMPAFSEVSWEVAQRDNLIAQFSQHRDIIQRLTRV